ncbi:hypothetical protein [Cryptosporangium sp. NPDC048952]|uniref:hypothetical protein n=1 Tax=Cryptosporangium sp. NPDC048952 TaxID=3363961 RepID=UPI00371584C9
MLRDLPTAAMLPFARTNVPALREFAEWNDDQLWTAIEAHRQASDAPATNNVDDLRTPEWEIFTAHETPVTADFTLRRNGVPAQLKEGLRRRRPGRAAPRGAGTGGLHPTRRARPGRP